MLDRLAQLIVDKLRPQLERVIDELFVELQEHIEGELDDAFTGAVSTFNIHVAKTLPKIKDELKREVTQQIVKGIKL